MQTAIELPKLSTLAADCRAAGRPSRVLEGRIFLALHHREGDVWTDLIGDDDVWHRRDPKDRAAWDAPSRCTESFDAALLEKIDGVRIVGMEEPKAAQFRWTIDVRCDAMGRTFRGEGVNAALALMDGLLQVHAELRGDA